MELSPQAIRTIGFKTVKKGYDPAEVDSFKDQAASAVESAQNQATAMEARARAAVAKLQEMSQQVTAAAEATPSKSGDTEVISRTLLLAQRTADTTVSEARVEAETITAGARDEANRLLDNARSVADKVLDEARADARRSVGDERAKAENEVQALLARRDFLLSDVDHLEKYISAQRERLRDAAVQLQDLVDRVPGGLGEMRRPLLSASAEPLPAGLHPLAPSDAFVEPDDEFDDDDDDGGDNGDTDLDNGASGTRTSPSINTMARSTNPEDQENVWRMLDEELAGKAPQQSSDDVDDDGDDPEDLQ